MDTSQKIIDDDHDDDDHSHHDTVIVVESSSPTIVTIINDNMENDDDDVDDDDKIERKSVEDLLCAGAAAAGSSSTSTSTHETQPIIAGNNSIGQAISFTNASVIQASPIAIRKLSTPMGSPRNSPKASTLSLGATAAAASSTSPQSPSQSTLSGSPGTVAGTTVITSTTTDSPPVTTTHSKREYSKSETHLSTTISLSTSSHHHSSSPSSTTNLLTVNNNSNNNNDRNNDGTDDGGTSKSSDSSTVTTNNNNQNNNDNNQNNHQNNHHHHSRQSQQLSSDAEQRPTTSKNSTAAAAASSSSSSKISERAKKKSWYNVLYPSYKSRSEDFKKLFKGVPDDERLVVDYSCAIQKDILVHGRLYVSQNYLCFYANIFRWETCLCIRWKDVTAVTKEKTARVIPNAILVCTESEKHFFTSFTTRDKAYLMLFRVWQNALMHKQMQPQEMWQWVHNCYGDELGLTSDDEDYIDPKENNKDLDLENQQLYSPSNKSTGDSVSEEHSETQSDAMSSSNPSKNGLDTFKDSNKTSQDTSKLYKKSSDQSPSPSAAAAAAALPLMNTLTLPPSSTIQSTKNFNQRKNLSKLNRNKQQQQQDNQSQKLIDDDHRNKLQQQQQQLPQCVSEQLPTDMSDSSDSDAGKNNIPFISTAECTSMHEGRQLVHTILPINIENLFNLLFSKSKFLVEFHNNRKTTNMIHRDWTINDDGLKARSVNLTVALTQAVGPKCSHVTENQVMRECSEPGQLYSIDITTTNAGIPYADSFYVLMHYCLVRTVDDHTMFSVHAQIKYKKSIWGMMKGFIEKNTWAGLEDFYTSLLRSLQSEYCIPPAKSKGRRPRKNINSIQRPLEELPLHVKKSIQIPFVFNRHHIVTKTIGGGGGGSGGGGCVGGAGGSAGGGGGSGIGIGNSTGANNNNGNPMMISNDIQYSYKYEATSIIILILLIGLILLNVILYFKLRALEQQQQSQSNRFPDFTMLKNPPKSQEDWIHLLKHQEVLHTTEMMRWQTVLQTAIELLKKTEKTLSELLILISVQRQKHEEEESKHPKTESSNILESQPVPISHHPPTTSSAASISSSSSTYYPSSSSSSHHNRNNNHNNNNNNILELYEEL